jgi:hypothetical protein
VVKILLRIQQALPSILSTYADALTDCHASLPFLSFKYWDIILTQATAASASHLVMHNHTLSLCNRTCAVDKMSLNELEEYSDTQNKYWDIILTQATAASASHLVMHNHTLS